MNGDANGAGPKNGDEMPLSRLVTCMIIFGMWSVGVGIAHALIPDRFDLVSVICVEIALAPLLIFLFQDLQFGFGDWKVGLKPNMILRTLNGFRKTESLPIRTEIEALGTRVGLDLDSRATIDSPEFDDASASRPASLRALDEADDGAVLVVLRSEISHRLRRIAHQYGVPAGRGVSTSALLDMLTDRNIIGAREASGLLDLIRAGNLQAGHHGYPIQSGTAEAARIQGEELLIALDAIASQPEKALVWQIAERAAAAGKVRIVFQAFKFADGWFRPDILIPHEVLIEAKLNPSLRNADDAVIQLGRYMGVIADVKGLVVLGAKPLPQVMSALRSRSNVSVSFAWRDVDRFDGYEAAKEFAPWLLA